MNIDGHKFNFPEQAKKLIPPIEKTYPAQDHPQNKNENNFPESENWKKSSEKSPEEKRKEKNELEDKGHTIDITI